ncbi:MAG: aldolase/citrate lyase family protein [Sulfolobales archaeon]
MVNRVKEKISKGEVTYGTWITMGYPEITEALSHLPFDWFVIDMEHTPLDVKDVEFLMMPLRFTNIVPIVRVPWNDFIVIKRVLDCGAQGILVPQVENKDEALQAVKAVKYPPWGIRGVGPRRCVMYGFKSAKEYFKTANEETLVIVQIESENAVNNVEEILSVNGIDGVFVGPNDLSASLGIFQEFNNPKYIAAVDKVLNAAKAAGKIAGIMTSDPQDALDKVKKGFNFISLRHDIAYMIKGYTDAFKLLGVLK